MIKGYLAVCSTSPYRDSTSPFATRLASQSQHRPGAMEVKVFVDGIPRVVCGVTEETSCQEVVIALAQALGMYSMLVDVYVE